MTDATKARRSARSPSHARGVVRFNALLDATEALLLEHNPDEIGLYQIAEEAGVPPASVYHFLPTKGAAFLALTERYLAGFRELLSQPVEASRLKSWQDLVALGQERAVDYYSGHLPAMKILLGGFPSWEVRQVDVHFSETLALNYYTYYDEVFYMPHVADAGHKFRIGLAIIESIWAISFSKHQRITEEYAADALDASIAYLRLFLPQFVEPRPKYQEAARRGELVALPAHQGWPVESDVRPDSPSAM